MLTAKIIIDMTFVIKTGPFEDTDISSYVSFVYRQRRMSYTFSLSETVCVFRIPAEIPEQTRSPASRVSNYKVDRFLGCGMHPQPPSAGHLGWLVATLAVSRNPRTYAPFVTQTHTGSY